MNVMFSYKELCTYKAGATTDERMSLITSQDCQLRSCWHDLNEVLWEKQWLTRMPHKTVQVIFNKAKHVKTGTFKQRDKVLAPLITTLFLMNFTFVRALEQP